MRKSLLIVSVAVFGLSFGCGGKDAKDKPATAVDTVAAAPDTATTFTDTRDGKVYRRVKIGTQVWMAQNLNYAAEESACFQTLKQNCAEYGRLYYWHTALKACPAEYRLPTDDEWTTLVDYAGGWETAGTKLKSSTGWLSHDRVPVGTDDYGFSALPAGYGPGGTYPHFSGFWWSATEYNASDASVWHMENDRESVLRHSHDKTDFIVSLFSVRCVQDKEGEQ